MKPLLITASIFFSSVYGQSVSFGVKAGIPLTDAVEGSYGNNSAAKRYTVGPMVEIGLPFSFAFEVDALYRRTGYDSSFSNFAVSTFTHVRANSWEFPLLAKYYFSPRILPIRLYVSGGYVIRHISDVAVCSNGFETNVGTGVTTYSSGCANNPQYYLENDPTHGVAAGVGARLRVGPIKISPEVRYTYWGGRPFDQYGSQGYYVQSTQNQVDLLVGIAF